MNIPGKLLVFFIPTTLGLSWGVLQFSKQAVHSALVQETAKTVLSRCDAVAHGVGGLLQDSRAELSLLPLLQAAKKELGAVHAFVLNLDGTVAAHTNVVERGKAYSDAFTTEALRSRSPLVRETAFEGSPMLEIALPVYRRPLDEADGLLFSSGDAASGDQRLGTLQLIIPLAEKVRIGGAIYAKQAGILLGGMATVSAALIFFIWAGVVAPVRRLIVATHRIISGSFGETIPIPSRDELGVLTASFNVMSRTLKSTTVSKSELQASENRYRRLADHTTDGLFIHDSAGRIHDVNAAACRNLGYTREELLALSVSDIEDNFSQEGLTAVWNDLQGGGIHSLDGIHRRKDGSTFPVEVRISLIDSSPEGLIYASVRDVTDAKTMQQRMLQSEKLSAVGQLAAGVAHELNNPLGIILGFAQAAVKRIVQDRHLSMPLKSIEREAIRCRDLVQNLLSFSRQRKAGNEVFTLRAAMDSALSLVAAQARVRSVEVRADLEGESLRIRGNETETQQVLINLCSNAIDAMPKGGILTVSSREGVVDGKRSAILSVGDTGMGIPDHVKSKIFDPFFTTKDPGKGTGLGLSLVYEIVHKHSGTIDCRSEVGKGTTFIVSLPAVAGEARA